MDILIEALQLSKVLQKGVGLPGFRNSACQVFRLVFGIAELLNLSNVLLGPV